MPIQKSIWTILPYAALLLACGEVTVNDSQPDSGSEGDATPIGLDCDQLVGASYLAVVEGECGLGPDGPVLCKWSISFTADMFNWLYSDVGEIGLYTCDDSTGDLVITAEESAAPYQGMVSATTGLLTWNGDDYELTD